MAPSQRSSRPQSAPRSVSLESNSITSGSPFLIGKTGKNQRRRQYIAVAVPVGLLLIVVGFVANAIQTSAPLSPVRKSAVAGNEIARPSKVAPPIRQPRPSPPITDDEIYAAIITGQINLVAVRSSGLANGYVAGNVDVMGTFCPLAFETHTADPSSLPMFKDLLAASPLCSKREWRFQANIGEAARRIAEYDKTNSFADIQKEMFPPSGFVFHESRCGSTLAANSLAAAGEHVRVYSESAPPAQVLKGCTGARDRCDRDDAAALLRDVVQLMSRAREAEIGDGAPPRRRTFFKIQSIGTHGMDIVTHAFRTPWIFVYRDPTQVMMSHVGKKRDASRSNCARGRSKFYTIPQIGKLMIEDGEENGDGNPTDARKIDAVTYCAVHLAAICRSAVAERERQGGGFGRFANYQDLVKNLVTDFFPNHFKLELTETMEENIYRVTKNYSKGRIGKAGEFKDDSQSKEAAASQVVKLAAERFMMPSFRRMEELAALDKR